MPADIKIPNLPDRNVGLVLVKDDLRTVSALKALGIDVLSPEKAPELDEEVAEHADMLCCPVGGGVCVTAPRQTRLAAALEANGFTVLFSSPLKKSYPGDIALNFAVSESFALGNFAYADPILLECINNKKRIDVKQGYAKCSLCFVNENAFITEDAGIASALTDHGAEVLRISAGDVFLSEKHTGFFGGATGKISRHALAINGSLSYHRDGDAIRAFLKRHKVEPVELFDGRLTDIGGIIPLKEKE